MSEEKVGGRFFLGLSICSISVITFFEGGEPAGPIGRLFDWFGLYLIASLELSRVLARLFDLNLVQLFAVYLGSTTAMTLVTNGTWLSSYRSSTFGVELGILCGLAFVLTTHRQSEYCNRFLAAAMVVYALASIFWFSDKILPMCGTSIIHRRAVWRALCILALGCLDLFFSSETHNHHSELPVLITQLPAQEVHPLVLCQ